MYTKYLLHLEALLPILVPSLSIIFIAILFAILLKKKLVETIFLSITTTILILFLTGVLNYRGSLLLGYAIIIIFSLFSFCIFINSYIKNKNIVREISLLPGLMLFASFLSIAIYLNYGRKFIIWDEFSHWGSVLKHMYNLNALASLKDTVGQFSRTYPPISSIFQYFWMKPFSTFTEYPAYIASNMFFFSLIMMFLKKFNLRSALFLITSLLIPIALPFLQDYNFFSSLYVDAILGILLGFMLLIYYKDDSKERIYKLIVISGISFVLTLTKDTGFIFALIGNSIILGDFLLFRRQLLKKFFQKKNKLINKLKYIFPLILPFFVTILVKLIWWGHLKLVGASSLLEEKPINLQSLLRQDFLPYQQDVLLNFRTAIIQKPIAPLEYPALKLIAILFGIFIILNFVFNTNLTRINRLTYAFIGLTLGGIAYACSILVAYLFVFGANEATILASYSRYMLSYLISYFFFLLIFILIRQSELQKAYFKKRNFVFNLKRVLAVLLTFSIYYSLLNRALDNTKTIIFESRSSVHSTIIRREKYKKVLQWRDEISNKDKGVYLISQESTGYDTLVLIYTLYPSNIEWNTDYSVGLEKYHNHFELGDPWTMIISAEDWGQYVINNYYLVYIHRYDEKFRETYGYYFDNLENYALYEVTTNDEGILELISIPKP